MTKVYVRFEGYREGNYLDGYILGITKKKKPEDVIDNNIHYLEFEIK
jgi:hypothetical protein